MVLERLFYYRGESRTGGRAFARNGYLLAAIYIWASSVIFALDAPYPLLLEAYLLTVWMAPAALYWTPPFQRGIVDRFLLASPVEAKLPARAAGFALVLLPLVGTLFLALASAGYVVSRQRGQVQRIHQVIDAIQAREAELLDEIRATNAAEGQRGVHGYLRDAMEEIHATPIHPRDIDYRKQVLADMETNIEALERAATGEETA